MNYFTINIESLNLTDDQFFLLCQENETLILERNANGDLIVMPLRGAAISIITVELTAQIYSWNEQTKLGVAFSSTTGFQLANGAVRCPHASWILLSRWHDLTAEQKEKFVPFAPDFVVELVSATDDLKRVRAKMAEYRDNGSRLGWLINRELKQVEVYRPREEIEILESPNSLSGETVLPGFVLDMESIW